MVLARLMIVFLPALAISAVSARAQGPTNPEDYFNPRHDRMLLYNVERYHLSRDTFFGFYNDGKYNLATEELKFVLRYFPNHPRALMLMESVGKLSGNPLLAYPYYDNAVKLFPQHALTHAQFGSYLKNIDQVDAGIARLKEALEIDPQLALAHAWLSEAYAKKGDAKLAAQYAEQARRFGYVGDISGQPTKKQI
jgi:Tfp pilus assembly protein PilF